MESLLIVRIPKSSTGTVSRTKSPSPGHAIKMAMSNQINVQSTSSEETQADYSIVKLATYMVARKNVEDSTVSANAQLIPKCRPSVLQMGNCIPTNVELIAMTPAWKSGLNVIVL